MIVFCVIGCGGRGALLGLAGGRCDLFRGGGLRRLLGGGGVGTRPYGRGNDQSRRTSQRGFLRNLARGEAYQSEAPTLWDVRFEMAVSQAELADRDQPGAYHQIAFARDGADPVAIDTTCPHLSPACVALAPPPDHEH